MIEDGWRCFRFVLRILLRDSLVWWTIWGRDKDVDWNNWDVGSRGLKAQGDFHRKVLLGFASYCSFH